MPVGFDTVAKEAWDVEIKARILVIDEGRETGASFEEMMADADIFLMNQQAKTRNEA